MQFMSSHPHFATTQWTLVWKAAVEDSQAARPALEEIISRYWQTLYGYGRRSGLTREDAEDATQEFLSGVVSGNFLQGADPAKGRFRTYLLTAWKRFLIDEFRKRSAAKRGGDRRQVDLNFELGERRWLSAASQGIDADHLFMRNWADGLLAEVRRRLADEYSGRGKNVVFEALAPALGRNLKQPEYEQLANQLNLSANAVKVALFRLRQRFGEALRIVVAETVEDPADVDAEITDLLRVVGGGLADSL